MAKAGTALATGRQRAGTAGARRGANRDLGQTSRPCLPLSLSLQRESANILISSHTQTLRPDPRIHILGDLHKLPAINRAHEVQGLKASTLAKKTVQEDWKGGEGRGLQSGAGSTAPARGALGWQRLALASGSPSGSPQAPYPALGQQRPPPLHTRCCGIFPPHLSHRGRASGPPCPPQLTPMAAGERSLSPGPWPGCGGGRASSREKGIGINQCLS